MSIEAKNARLFVAAQEIVSEGYTLELDTPDLKGLGRIKPKVVAIPKRKPSLLQMFREQGTDLGIVIEELK
jgi:hypothetical protein